MARAQAAHPPTSPDITQLLQASFIRIGLEADSAEAAIRGLCQPLQAARRVEPAYADDTWRREQAIPTGLPTEPVAVALPHADPDHVLSPALAIGLLSTPVEFMLMGSDPPQPLAVHVVFLLALKEREQQAPFLRALMLILQAKGVLAALVRCRSAAEVMEVLRAAAADSGEGHSASA